MRSLYGLSDDKFVKVSKERRVKKVSPLSSYIFRLSPTIQGKPSVKEFDKEDVPIVFKCGPESLVNLCAKVVDALPLPRVYTWTIDDVCKWLRERGYRQYQNTFRVNLISGRNLLLLDASALTAMNIKDFDHIKDITREIRSLFYFEMTKFGRSVTLYPEFHNELYKIFRLQTGKKYDEVRRSDLWRKMQMIRQKESNSSHWEVLEKWLKFDKEPELFGGVRRSNLYNDKSKPTEPPVTSRLHKSCSCLSLCECYMNDSELRLPWHLKCLPHLTSDKEFVKNCRCCDPPCTCRWSFKNFVFHGALTCLQKELPDKYGRHRHSKIKPFNRLSFS